MVIFGVISKFLPEVSICFHRGGLLFRLIEFSCNCRLSLCCWFVPVGLIMEVVVVWVFWVWDLLTFVWILCQKCVCLQFFAAWLFSFLRVWYNYFDWCLFIDIVLCHFWRWWVWWIECDTVAVNLCFIWGSFSDSLLRREVMLV